MNAMNELRETRETRPAAGTLWRAVVWNDPINLMSYVTWVLQRHFGFSRAKATRLMMQIHTVGRATVSEGARERIETDVTAMHGFGLWATIERGDH